LGDVARFSAAIVQIVESGLERYQELSNRSAKTALEFSWPPIAAKTLEEYRQHLNRLAGLGDASSCVDVRS
jgi:hypothetical protein